MALLVLLTATAAAGGCAGVHEARIFSPNSRQKEGEHQLFASQRIQVAGEQALDEEGVVEWFQVTPREPLAARTLGSQEAPFKRDEGHFQAGVDVLLKRIAVGLRWYR
jgi:hypothetical protein